MKQPSSIITRRTGNSYLLGKKFWPDNTFQFFPASAGIIPEFSLYLFFHQQMQIARVSLIPNSNN
jgi:hypothetical protein